MSQSIGAGWGTGDAGAGPGAALSPDSVAVAAQRIAVLAGELDGVRRQAGAVEAPEWRSPAAAAFLAALTDLVADLSATVRALEAAAGEVGSYGMRLRTSSPANGCLGLQDAGIGNRAWPGVGPASMFDGRAAPWWGP